MAPAVDYIVRLVTFQGNGAGSVGGRRKGTNPRVCTRIFGKRVLVLTLGEPLVQQAPRAEPLEFMAAAARHIVRRELIIDSCELIVRHTHGAPDWDS